MSKFVLKLDQSPKTSVKSGLITVLRTNRDQTGLFFRACTERMNRKQRRSDTRYTGDPVMDNSAV